MDRDRFRRVMWFAVVIVFIAFLMSMCDKAHSAETASWYSTQSCQKEGTSGILTANGEQFDENAPTCAMRSRDFGKYYKITNLDNGKSVVVRHNDFGPNKKLWKRGRIVDLSKGAFARIAELKQGVINVKVEVL